MILPAHHARNHQPRPMAAKGVAAWVREGTCAVAHSAKRCPARRALSAYRLPARPATSNRCLRCSRLKLGHKARSRAKSASGAPDSAPLACEMCGFPLTICDCSNPVGGIAPGRVCQPGVRSQQRPAKHGGCQHEVDKQAGHVHQPLCAFIQAISPMPYPHVAWVLINRPNPCGEAKNRFCGQAARKRLCRGEIPLLVSASFGVE